MRKEQKNVSLKSFLRQPVRALLLLAFIAVLSFACVSRTAEYLIVRQEVERLSGAYRAVGELIPYEGMDVSAGAEVVRANAHVAFENIQRSCLGLLTEMHNADLLGATALSSVAHDNPVRNLSADVLLTGRLQSAAGELLDAFTHRTTLEVLVDAVEAGHPEYAAVGDTVTIRYDLKRGEGESAGAFKERIAAESLPSQLRTGERYLVRAWYSIDLAASYNFKLNWRDAGKLLTLKPLTEQGALCFPLEQGASVDYSAAELAGLAEERTRMEEDQRSVEIVGAKDVSALPYAQLSSPVIRYHLDAGRFPNLDDDHNAHSVCAITSWLAEQRGLELGDTIKVTLRNARNDYGTFVYRQESMGEWEAYPTYEAEYEIVGTYTPIVTGSHDLSATYWCNLIFVPDSCLPQEFGLQERPYIDRYDYSFVLESVKDQEAFLQEMGDALEALGIQASFLENNAGNFFASADPLLETAAWNVSIFSAVMLLTLCGSAFLYLRWRRRELAILRALGVPRKACLRQLLLPTGLLVVAGALAGVAGWYSTLAKREELLSALPEAGAAALAPALLALIGLLAAIAGIFLLFVALGGAALLRCPVLELLQAKSRTKAKGPEGGRTGGVAETSLAPGVEEESAPARRPGQAGAIQPQGNRQNSLPGACRYLRRQICRDAARSLLAIAVALGLMLALGYMRLTIARSAAEADRLYATTIVPGEILTVFTLSDEREGTIPHTVVAELQESGDLQNMLLEGKRHYSARNGGLAAVADAEDGPEIDETRVYHLATTMVGFQDMEAFMTAGAGRALGEIQYADGWNAERFLSPAAKDAVPVLLDTRLLEQVGFEPGQEAWLLNATGTRNRVCVIAGSYGTPGAGYAPAPLTETTVYLPLWAQQEIEGSLLKYSTVRFEVAPEHNRALDEVEERIIAALGRVESERLRLQLVLWDAELRQVVEPLEKTLSLFALLYPVALALVALIGAGLSLLLVFQSAREAAALRALGVPKGRIRAMFTAQQGLLCLPGLLLGFLGLLLLQGDAAKVFSVDSLLCAGLYLLGTLLGAYFGAMAVTRRKPMELLQVKE